MANDGNGRIRAVLLCAALGAVLGLAGWALAGTHAQAIEIGVMKSQYGEVIRRLEIIEYKVDQLGDFLRGE